MKLLKSLAIFGLATILSAQAAAQDNGTNGDPNAQLIRSASTGDLDGVRSAIDKGADVNHTSKLGFTAWTAAKRAGYEELATFLAAKGAQTDLPGPSLEEIVDNGVREAFGEEDPGCALLVARDGEIVIEKAFGNANIEMKTPVEIDTKFRIGSITKQFTAAAVLKLQEEGKLSVSDSLSKYIPDFPRGDEVTLHHLLTHTSGIQSYTGKPDFMETVEQPVTETDLIDSFKNDPYQFDPGEKYEYNNSGYFLLGHIVAKVSGKSYADYLQEAFFGPIGMTNSGVHSSERELDNEANGYSIIDGNAEPAINWDMSRAGGAGAIYSTVRDLYKWNEAVFNGKVLSPKSLASAFSTVKLNDGTKSDYGYGWIVGSHRGLRTVQHSGGLNGFLSHLVRYPEHNTTIVVLCNAMPSGHIPPPAAVSQRLGEQLLWQEMETRPIHVVDSTVDPANFGDFVGTYDYGSSTFLDVTLEGDKLFAQLTGQQKFRIYPRNENTFFWKVVDAEVEFVRDDDGNVIKAIHRQNGTTSENRKVDKPESIDLTEEKLDAFVGQYDYVSAIMTVKREGKQLTAQITGQPAFKIFPKTKTKFVWRVVDAEVEFVKDEKGNVVKGVHTQGGRTFDAAKIEEVKPIEVPPEKLDEYVGQYNYGLFRGKMEIVRKGEKLTAKLRGQRAMEIVPIGPDEFRWKDVNASIKFERDEDGNIVRGLHTQGGRTIKVPRVD